MVRTSFAGGCAAFAKALLPIGIFCCGQAALCQEYPLKPIRVITAAVGGSTDFTIRLIGQGLTASLGQPVVVENRGGGGGLVAAEATINAAPDGYTLLAYGPTIWLLPLLRSNARFDPLKDFSPITWTIAAPNVLVVHPALPVKSVANLIALARARPGALNYGSGATGATTHLAAELFKSLAGVDIVRVNYKGAGQAINDLVAGHVQLMFSTAAAVSQQVKSGRLRALAITSARRSALLPGLPTVAEAGLPGYQVVGTMGLFGPAKMPRKLVDRLNQETVRVLNRPDVKERIFNAGAEVVASSPEELADMVKGDMAMWGKVIKSAGIQIE